MKEKESEGVNYEIISPIDFWRLEENQTKPIGEITYNVGSDGPSYNTRAGGKLLMSTEVKVSIRQHIVYSDSTLHKELSIPIRFFKKFSSPLVEEEDINLGIMTSPELAHKYTLRVENRYGKPAVITKVAIDKRGAGITVKVATIFGYKIVLPVGGPAFDLITLFAYGDENAIHGYISGHVHIYLDVSGAQEKVTVPFNVGYFKDLFAEESKASFELKRNLKDGKIMNTVNVELQNNFMVDYVIKDLNFSDIEASKGLATFTSLTRNKRLAVGETYKGISVQFIHPESYFDNIFSRGYEIVTLKTMQSFGTILIKYYTMNLMCGVHTAVGANYEKCKNLEKLEFGYIALNHKKIATMDIFNPTMVSYIIKRIEFSSSSGNVEVSFESQSKYSMKSFFKKATKTMNTFVLIPKNEVVSLRVRVKPKEAGNFREVVSIFTNHGEFNLAISYKGIQGEILFSPPALKFDLFYPVESEEKSVMAKNKFNIDVEVRSAWSPQGYIFTHLKNPYLKENSKDNFLGVVLDMTDEQMTENNRSNFLRTSHEKYITLADLVSYEDQIRGWDRILKMGKTDISGEVIIQTDLMSDLKIPVKGHIKKVSFLTEERLVVGPLEENRSHYINVTLNNPTERDIGMRFFIGDQQLLDFKTLYRKVMKKLRRKYGKYKQEQLCLTHSTIDEDATKYFAEILFEGITIKSVSLTKNNKKRVCFTINLPRDMHNRFHDFKGNYMYQTTILSRDKLVRDHSDIYILKDILRLSRRKPPLNPQSLYGLRFMDKLRLLYSRYRAVLRARLHKPQIIKSRDSERYLSSTTKLALESIITKQEFFLNPKYWNKRVVVPAGQTVSLPLVVCHPKGGGEGKMNLLIKNDYSNLLVLPISAQLGKVSLIVQKVIYINEGVTTSIVQKKEEYHKLIFSIPSADLIQKMGRDNKKYAFKKNVKRVFELKNNGNLPLVVRSISVGSQGCSFNGFSIVNCNGFDLAPGQTHRLEIVLLQTHSFQTELKKEIHFLMDSRVLVLEFEVKPGDSLTVELASFGFSNIIYHIFRILIVTFVFVLLMILFRYYTEKNGDSKYGITDLEKERFGSVLFYDNIFDLKILEDNVKYQKLEIQKNRLVRNVGLKQLMMNNLKEAGSLDVSMTSEPLEPERIHQEEKPLDLPETPKQMKVVLRKVQRESKTKPNPPTVVTKQVSKKPKHKKTEPQYSPPKIINTDSEIREEDRDTENILAQIDDGSESGRNELEDKKPQYFIDTRPHIAESAPILHSQTLRAGIPLEEVADPQKLKEEEPKDVDHSKQSFGSKPSNRLKHKGSFNKDESKEGRSYREQASKSVNKSKNSQKQTRHPEPTVMAQITNKRKRESGRHRESDSEDSEIYLPKVDKPTESAHLSERNIRVEPSKKHIETYEPRDRKQENPQVKYDVHENDRKREQAVAKQIRDIKKREPKKSEEVYYQRKVIPTPEKEEQEVEAVPINPRSGFPKAHNPEEDINRHPAVQAPAIQPLSNITSPGRIPPTDIRQRLYNRLRQNSNKSFSQEGQEEDQHIQHSFDRFNQAISFQDNNISEIDNVEENISNTSNIMILREHAEEPVRRGPPVVQEKTDSDESIEDVEKSHEKIRKLMEDTEEVKYENLDSAGEQLNNSRVVGVIGEKVKKKPSQPRHEPTSWLGFRQSEESYKPLAQPQQSEYGREFQRPLDRLQSFRGSPLHELNPRPQDYAYSPYPNQHWIAATSPNQPRPTPQFKMYTNPYGSFITKESIIQQQQQMVYSQAPGYGYAAGYGQNVNPLGQGIREEAYYGSEHSQEERDDEYYAGQEEHYERAYRQEVDVPEKNQKQFKAAMNNPFTLSKLAGTKTEGYAPIGHTGWNPNYGEYSRPEEEYEDSGYSGNNFSRSKGGMKPPPGLTRESEPFELQKEDPAHSRGNLDPYPEISEDPSGEQPRLRFKKADKTRYNLFG